MPDPKLDHSRPFSLAVVSHRRSGTHLLIEYLRRNFLSANPSKSHQFPEYLPHNLPFIHVVRNPWDTLWATYRWFSTGKCGNATISDTLARFSFREWVTGRAGSAFGFRDFAVENRDSLRISRGMFFDPVAYWVAHTEAWLALQKEGKLLSVKYEQLVRDPEGVMAAVSAYLKMPMQGDRVALVAPEEGVGHAPERNAIGYSAPQWTEDMEFFYQTLEAVEPLLRAMGYANDVIPGIPGFEGRADTATGG